MSHDISVFVILADISHRCQDAASVHRLVDGVIVVKVHRKQYAEHVHDIMLILGDIRAACPVDEQDASDCVIAGRYRYALNVPDFYARQEVEAFSH